MRKTPSDNSEMDGLEELQNRQKAYDAMSTKLHAYNGRYKPIHVPEVSLNNPKRLRLWCLKIQKLYLRIEHDPRAVCPHQLLTKGYRCADRIGIRLKKELFPRNGQPTTVREAINELGAIAHWCDPTVEIPPTEINELSPEPLNPNEISGSVEIGEIRHPNLEAESPDKTSNPTNDYRANGLSRPIG
jgi:hypothetical protein